ncbi:glycine cleavage system protein R [Desulfopila sp. IMCC35008]|uniref:glycine cleavage system protein R n=1 Tax=Desulfopila sp. IMCC35008 TaxID=2653858 RepID=UPI0013D1A475|nr:ACT domain-containing protein [Desulfopila sp. IMCC35008]
MSSRFIMTAFGRDRVGIVADVTRLLYENDCNLEDTNMTILADEFSLNLLFSSRQGNIEDVLSGECRRLELEKGISAFVRPIGPRASAASNGFTSHTLHIEGLDQAGIVYKTSRFLAEKDINIMHLNSSAKPSPESGAPLYNMDIHVQVPSDLGREQMEEKLNAVADELQVDITVVQ